MPENSANAGADAARQTVNVSDVTIRAATREDCPRMLELIRELADYERAPDQVTVTLSEMEECGFGPRAFWGAFVAELRRPAEAPVVIGMALYYYRYSTWKGRMLYLEDFVVSDVYRGGGVGRMLFDRVLQFARDEGCHGMTWQALNWNEPALNFYRKYNSEIDPGWNNCTVRF